MVVVVVVVVVVVWGAPATIGMATTTKNRKNKICLNMVFSGLSGLSVGRFRRIGDGKVWDGGWGMEAGWRMEDEGWRQDGGWRMEEGGGGLYA